MNIELVATADHPSKSLSDLVKIDPTIINLTVGEPGYGPPAAFLNTFRDLLALRDSDPSPQYNRYASSRGTEELRQQISSYYTRLYNLYIDPTREILVTNG